MRQILLNVCPPAKFVPSGTVTSATYAASLAHVLLALLLATLLAALLLDDDVANVGPGTNVGAPSGGKGTVGATVGTSEETFV